MAADGDKQMAIDSAPRACQLTAGSIGIRDVSTKCLSALSADSKLDAGHISLLGHVPGCPISVPERYQRLSLRCKKVPRKVPNSAFLGAFGQHSAAIRVPQIRQKRWKTPTFNPKRPGSSPGGGIRQAL
jgi:hypothetical protein